MPYDESRGGDDDDGDVTSMDDLQICEELDHFLDL
jgi:hypothetical protein